MEDVVEAADRVDEEASKVDAEAVSLVTWVLHPKLTSLRIS